MTKDFKRTVELTSNHELGSFDCGVPDLNIWLRTSALRNQKENTSRTFVLTEDEKVVAFYCLATASTERESLPNSKQRNSPRDVPLISLGRLAVDIKFQGLGIGALLLRDAIARSLAATEHVAAKFMRVDAKNEDVARFYERFGFTADPNNPLILYLKFPKR
jgi:ribosomal protein S18 acetylase RimI-like enzyme